jgi:hypothetical protein
MSDMILTVQFDRAVTTLTTGKREEKSRYFLPENRVPCSGA